MVRMVVKAGGEGVNAMKGTAFVMEKMVKNLLLMRLPDNPFILLARGTVKVNLFLYTQ